MRISFFVPRCTPDNSHGRYVIELAKRLGADHQVTVYGGAFWPQLRAIARCRFLPVPNRPAIARMAALWIESLVSTGRNRQDIIHIQGADAAVGNVVTAHCCNAAMHASSDGQGTLARRLNYAIGAKLERYCFTKASTRAVIAVSQKVRAEIQAYYEVDGGKIVVIPPGVDSHTFQPLSSRYARQAARERFGLRRDDFVVSYVGGDYRLKGFVTLLKAVGLVSKSVKIIAVGVVPDSALEAFISRHGLQQQVRFLGRTDPGPCYSAADCFVLPTRYDTFSLATLEAMASGLPVIVTNAAGISEHLSDGVDSIVLQDPGDIAGLARHLARLMSDEAFRISLGQEARNTAMRHSWERVAERMLGAYRQVA